MLINWWWTSPHLHIIYSNLTLIVRLLQYYTLITTIITSIIAYCSKQECRFDGMLMHPKVLSERLCAASTKRALNGSKWGKNFIKYCKTITQSSINNSGPTFIWNWRVVIKNLFTLYLFVRDVLSNVVCRQAFDCFNKNECGDSTKYKF